MEEQINHNEEAELTEPEPHRATSDFIWTEDDEESLRILKLGGVLGIFMLLAYLVYDSQVRGPNSPGIGWHWLLIAATCLLFGLAWTQRFRRRWKFWIMLYIVLLLAMFILISRATGDPESRFLAVMLCPLACAAFVSWGTRWQAVIAATALLAYVASEYLVPIPSPYGVYRWLGLIAALIVAQYTAIFFDRYRRRVQKQVRELEQAARFRQTQIATMVHDIRSPVAALTGYVNLLEEADIGPNERTDLLERIGSTAWNMDVVVSNTLDYYEVQEDDVVPVPADLDPNQVLSSVAEDCATQARRRHLNLRVELAPLPACRLDRHHLERIIRNMLGYVMGRTTSGDIVLRARSQSDSIVVEVTDGARSLSPAEMEELFLRPEENGSRGAARGLGLGLFLARAMAEAAGGRVDAGFAEGRRGLTITAELPLEAHPSKTRTP